MTDSIQSWLNTAGRFPLLPKSEVIRLAKKRDTLEPGSKAYIKVINKICNHNLRLVVTVAKTYANKRHIRTGSEMMADLLQLGYFGLRRAAEKYDAARGYTFSTYATPWVRQSVYRGAQYLENLIYIPENTQCELLYIRRHGERSKSKNGRIAQDYLNSADHALRVGSIDVRIEDDESATLSDVISNDNKILNGNEVFSDRRNELRGLLRKAGVKSRDIEFVMTYLRGGRIQSAASKCGISASRGREVYNAAISKLKALA